MGRVVGPGSIDQSHEVSLTEISTFSDVRVENQKSVGELKLLAVKLSRMLKR